MGTRSLQQLSRSGGYMGRVLAVCGMPASGKGEFAAILKDRGIPILSMGDMIREEVRHRQLQETPEIFGEIATRYDIDFYLRPRELGSSETKSDDVVADFMKTYNPNDIVVWVNTS